MLGQIFAKNRPMKIKGPMIFFLVVFTAQLKASEAIMIGFGQNSCEEFNSDVRESNQWAHHYFSWAAGYMSAINVRNQESFGEAIDLWPASFDGPKQMEFLKNYCSLNPDKMFALGVMTLFNELRKE